VGRNSGVCPYPFLIRRGGLPRSSAGPLQSRGLCGASGLPELRRAAPQVVLLIYCIRVYSIHGWYIVTYGLGARRRPSRLARGEARAPVLPAG